MRVSQIMLIGTLCFGLANAYAYNCIGDCQLGKETVDYVNSAVDIKLNSTTVTGNVHVAGKLEANAAKVKGLTVAGKTTLDNTVVEGEAKIAGLLTAHGSTLGDNVFIAAKAIISNSKFNKQVKIAGDAELLNSRVVGKTKVAGFLVAKSSVFDGNIELSGDKAIFSATKLNNNLIVESKDKTPVVELICGSTVKGQITFEGKPGIVKTEQPSQAKFKVKNGTIEHADDVTCSK